MNQLRIILILSKDTARVANVIESAKNYEGFVPVERSKYNDKLFSKCFASSIKARIVEYRILAWRSHARIKFFARRAKNFFY